jgi:hypothetical protein
MLNGLVSYYRGFNTNDSKGLKEKVIGYGKYTGFDYAGLKLADPTLVTEVETAKFAHTPVTANTALYGGTWATNLVIEPAAEADWSVPLSLWTVCGT